MNGGNQQFGRHGGGSSFAGSRGEAAGPSPAMTTLVDAISLALPDMDLFDTTAHRIADILADPSSPDANKSSQIRRFYDEVIRYQSAGEAAFAANLPFIRMICAHAAYSQSRKHVDANFVAFMQGGLRKVTTYSELKIFRTLFEAVIGFMPKKN
jgi:CRISPR-associated protein Csm2